MKTLDMRDKISEKLRFVRLILPKKNRGKIKGLYLQI